MNVDFSVRLPTDAESVPLVRGLLRQALQYLGVVPDRIEEIVLALTEACANVVQHAGRARGVPGRHRHRRPGVPDQRASTTATASTSTRRPGAPPLAARRGPRPAC